MSSVFLEQVKRQEAAQQRLQQHGMLHPDNGPDHFATHDDDKAVANAPKRSSRSTLLPITKTMKQQPWAPYQASPTNSTTTIWDQYPYSTASSFSPMTSPQTTMMNPNNITSSPYSPDAAAGHQAYTVAQGSPPPRSTLFAHHDNATPIIRNDSSSANFLYSSDEDEQSSDNNYPKRVRDEAFLNSTEWQGNHHRRHATVTASSSLWTDEEDGNSEDEESVIFREYRAKQLRHRRRWCVALLLLASLGMAFMVAVLVVRGKEGGGNNVDNNSVPLHKGEGEDDYHDTETTTAPTETSPKDNSGVTTTQSTTTTSTVATPPATTTPPPPKPTPPPSVSPSTPLPTLALATATASTWTLVQVGGPIFNSDQVPPYGGGQFGYDVAIVATDDDGSVVIAATFASLQEYGTAGNCRRRQQQKQILQDKNENDKTDHNHRELQALCTYKQVGMFTCRPDDVGCDPPVYFDTPYSYRADDSLPVQPWKVAVSNQDASCALVTAQQGNGDETLYVCANGWSSCVSLQETSFWEQNPIVKVLSIASSRSSPLAAVLGYEAMPPDFSTVSTRESIMFLKNGFCEMELVTKVELPPNPNGADLVAAVAVDGYRAVVGYNDKTLNEQDDTVRGMDCSPCPRERLFFDGYSLLIADSNGNQNWIVPWLNGDDPDTFAHLSILSANSLAMAANGTMIALGCSNRPPLTPGRAERSDEGQVHVWRRSGDGGGGSWTLVGSPIKSKTPGDMFGASVAVSAEGTILAVGAPNDGAHAQGAGRISVYRLIAESDEWVQVGNDIFGNVENAGFGSSLDVSPDGEWIVVGAPDSDRRGFEWGEVAVYRVAKV